MSDILMVPIHIDALYVQTARSTVEAMADFSRLPYFDGERDVNPDVAHISEEIVSTPFQNENLHLTPGVHLHWSLPDALTQGVQSDTDTTFPAVPNRWLITRGGTGSRQQWIVESDYIHPEGEGNSQSAVNIPVRPDPANGKYQPFRYLGRQLPLASWQPTDPQAEYLPLPDQYPQPLTAVGYGHPAFAAFYPNCFSVFGFQDGAPGDSIPGLTYEVIGWYGDAKQDALSKFIAAHPRATLDELQTAFNWTIDAGEWTSDVNATLPRQMLCYAQLNFQPASHAAVAPAEATGTAIAVGNTGSEALAAYLAHALSGKESPAIIEDQLEAIQFVPRLAGRQLDRGAKFYEARHEKGFTAVTAGALWTVVPAPRNGIPANAADAHAQRQVTLPTAVAHQLNELNLLQQRYDRALHQIESRRRQLFSDWYKYMLCAYPPTGDRGAYPDIDAVKYYIQAQRLRPLDATVAATGHLLLHADAAGRIQAAAASGDTTDALAARLAQAINDLQASVDGLTASADNAQTYALKQISSPRYWQPNDPVVLISGDIARPTARHGQDGLLKCQVLTGVAYPPVPADFVTISSKIESIKKKGGTSIAFSTQSPTQNPWNPFLLEWEVEVFPLTDGSNLVPERAGYEETFITDNYTLAETASDLAARQGKQVEVATAANVYSGSSILTPYAGNLLQTQLDAYLDDPNVDKDAAIYKTAQRARARLKDLHGLSQSLGGFNQALLMHNRTMQLDIADPLGFEDYQPFAQAVQQAVQRSLGSAPEPLNDFNPIRSGAMNITNLALVDTFGQVRALDCGDVLTTTQLAPITDHQVSLPPRLAQPARLDLRWLSADRGTQEMNSHPATTPICGWVLPNNLDDSLMFYDQAGKALGSIDQRARWEPVPGSADPVATPAGIQNPHLRQVTSWIIEQGATFLSDFISTVDSALENIEPENYAQHPALVLLMGRPIAVVRAAVNLELEGLPATHQGWNVFRQELGGRPQQSDGFTGVNFPVRIGEYRQLNDGVVGYWLENGDGGLGGAFYAPESDVGGAHIKSHSAEPLNLLQSVDAAPQTLTILLDPRGSVHATSGILPTKVINIPPDQYAAALQAIEVTFLSTPIITRQGTINLPLPAEPGYAWSWVEKENGQWSTTSSIKKISTQADFAGPQEIRDGWLKLSKLNSPDPQP